MGLHLTGSSVTQLNNAFVPRWQPSHAYLAGDVVMAPDGTIVQRNADGTSGSSYSGTNWTVVSGSLSSYATQVAALPDYPTSFPSSDEVSVVVYSGSVGTTRPGAEFVVWQGFPTQPTNSLPQDLWLSDTGGVLLSGAGAPTSGDGSNGDFWIRTSNSTLYGPKASGAWPTGVSLVGTTGATGAAGTNGTNGTNGASLAPTASKTSAYTATANDFVRCDASGGAFTVTLPIPTAGVQIGVKKTDSSTNAVTVATTSGTIDGSATRTLTAQYQAQVYLADGTNWQRVTVPGVTAIAATGTASSTTYLRGDGAWATPAGGAAAVDKAALLGPTGAIRATADRMVAPSSQTALTSGTLYLTAIVLQAGDVLTSLNVRTGSGFTTVTHSWAVLCDTSRNVLAVSPDSIADTAGSTTKTWTFGSAYTVPTTGMYYVGIMVAAATFNVVTVNVGLSSVPPIVNGTSSNAQTTPPSVGATMATMTSASAAAYIWLA